MATKPTVTPRMGVDSSGTVITTEIATPGGAKQDAGWEAGEEPAHTFFNWLFVYISLWIMYLRDGDLRDKHTLRHVNEDTFTPALAALDPSSGGRRSTIDHNGFRGGFVTEWWEYWNLTTVPAWWTSSVTGTGANTIDDPITTMPFRHLHMSTGTTNPSTCQVVTTPLGFLQIDNTLVIEWQIRTPAAVTDILYKGGMQFSHAGAWDYDIRFQCDSDADSSWRTFVSGSVTHDEFDTGIAFAANTTYRLRIEVCGDSNHDGSNGLARFFIDGTLVREFGGFTTPMTDAWRLWQLLTNSASGNDRDVLVGPIRACWNHTGSPPNI